MSLQDEKKGNDSKIKLKNTTGLQDLFSIELLDINRCREWVLQRLHPDGAYCPKCNRPIDNMDAQDSFWEGRRTHCKWCDKYFSARTGTVLNNTNLDVRVIYMILFLGALWGDEKVIAALLGIHVDTVRNWKRKRGEFVG